MRRTIGGAAGGFDQSGSRTARLLVLLVVVTASLGTIYEIISGLGLRDGFVSGLSIVTTALIPAVYAGMAYLITSRQPGNAIGWLLLIPAVSHTLDFLARTYLEPFSTAPVDTGAAMLVALTYSNLSWTLIVFPVIHLLLIFPDGTLLSRRWRMAVWFEVFTMSAIFVVIAFVEQTSPSDNRWTIKNPLGFVPNTVIDGPYSSIWGILLIGLVAMVLTSITKRYRNSDDTERHQIKWLLFAGSVFALVHLSASLTDDWSSTGIGEVLRSISLIGIPVAIAIAVLRYRLFEIDRLISRAVGYGLVVGILGLIYAVGAVWLPSLVSGESPVYIALSTLAVATLFNPLRRRTLRSVDRRFYRAKYNAEEVVDAFKSRLRDQTDLDRLTNDWVSVVSETMQPETVGVWVKHP